MTDLGRQLAIKKMKESIETIRSLQKFKAGYCMNVVDFCMVVFMRIF